MARHKWEKTGHLYDHTSKCLKCGCIKDSRAMYNTYYYLNDEKFENAPPCVGIILKENN